MKHPVLAVPALIVVALVALAGLVGLVRGDEPAPNPLPAVPPAPRGVEQYADVAADGSRIVVRRNGAWVWVRVDSAPTRDCTPEGGIDVNYLDAQDHRVRGDGGFTFRIAYATTARRTRRGFKGHEISSRVPKDVRATVTGRFVPGGRVVGTVRRIDEVGGDDDLRRCERRMGFDAERADTVPPPPAALPD